MSEVHPSAIIEPGAKLGDGAKIGPYCVVGAGVELGAKCELLSHVVIAGRTKIGPRLRAFPFASIGHEPQDLKYKGEASTLTIGADCIVREGVTINPGTVGGGMATTIGDHCAFLANSHVGHDCRIGNNVILSNDTKIGGHCTIGDHVIFGADVGVIQFARLGDHSFVGAMSGLDNDLIPFGMAVGNRAHLTGLNIVGMQRRGFSREAIHALRQAYRVLFGADGTFAERVEKVAAEFGGEPAVREVVDFIRSGGKRSLCAPREPES